MLAVDDGPERREALDEVFRRDRRGEVADVHALCNGFRSRRSSRCSRTRFLASHPALGQVGRVETPRATEMSVLSPTRFSLQSHVSPYSVSYTLSSQSGRSFSIEDHAKQSNDYLVCSPTYCANRLTISFSPNSVALAVRAFSWINCRFNRCSIGSVTGRFRSTVTRIVVDSAFFLVVVVVEED